MTLLNLPTAHDLARMGLAAQHPLSLDWSPEAVRLGGLEEEHGFDLQLATDLGLAQGRAERMALELSAEAYMNRWVEVSPGLEAMLSIRFEGGDAARPFVDVSVSSRVVEAGDLQTLVDAAFDLYGVFHPTRLRFWSPRSLPDVRSVVPGATPDMRVLAAPCSALRGGEVPDGLSLLPTRDAAQLPGAASAYAQIGTLHPAHVGQARLIEEDTLADAITAGTMFDVLWQGEWSGYAGTLPETQLGLPAQVVQELLLTPRARGRGLGPHLSTLLARHLPDDGRVLSGTIHAQNRGSLQAATRAGRHDLGGWWWLPLA